MFFNYCFCFFNLFFFYLFIFSLKYVNVVRTAVLTSSLFILSLYLFWNQFYQLIFPLVLFDVEHCEFYAVRGWILSFFGKKIFWYYVKLLLVLAQAIVTKYHKLVIYQKQNFISYSSRSWEVQGQGARWFGVYWELSSWL